MIKRDSKGKFVKGSSNPWNKGMKGYTNKGSFVSEKVQGKNNAFYGKHHTIESKNKISKNSGMKNKQEVREKVSKSLTGRKLKNTTKLKLKNQQHKRIKEGKHNFWKGGISKYYQLLNHALRNSQWDDWREKVFERDEYTCQECGLHSGNGKAVKLHPHHIHYVKKCVDENKLDLIYDIDNGVTLCEECHKIIHGKKQGA